MPGPTTIPRRTRVAMGAMVMGALIVLGSCDAGSTGPTPPPTPGTAAKPREVNLIAHEYGFVPATLDVIAGETVLLHVVNAGLEVHEAIIGDAAAQDAWEGAEAAVAGAPPGPTPLVSVPPGIRALRVVVRSGERVDAIWAVPTTAPQLLVGCHVPGHWAKGMQVPVRFTAP